MIKEHLIQNNPKTSRWINAMRANRNSSVYYPTYTPTQRAVVERAVERIQQVYTYKNIYVNYRKTMISVKLQEGVPVSPYDQRIMDDEFAGKGWTKAVTPQGVTYRCPR
jgi:hypothetical protein